MNEIIMASLLILIGFLMALIATYTGVYLTCKLLIGKGGTLPFVPEPVGDVFTIEDPDEAALFPEENDDKGKEKVNEEHILERTNKFLQTLGGGK